MPGAALLRLAEESPLLVAAILLGVFALFLLGMWSPEEKKTGRVVIIDDDPDIRLSLRRLIETKTTLELVGEAADGAKGVSVVDALVPDLVVIDVKMPVVDGVQATKMIKKAHPGVRVIGFSAVDDDPTGAIMEWAGASAYMVKGDSPDSIAATLMTIA